MKEKQLNKYKELWHILNEDNRTPDKPNVVPMTWLRCPHWQSARTAAHITFTTPSAPNAVTTVVN